MELLKTSSRTKEIFKSFHQLREFCQEHGSLFILKSNEFYVEDQLQKFLSAVQLLTSLGYIRALSDDRTPIYLITSDQGQFQCNMARVYRLTDKGQQLMEVLPVPDELTI